MREGDILIAQEEEEGNQVKRRPEQELQWRRRRKVQSLFARWCKIQKKEIVINHQTLSFPPPELLGKEG